MDSPGRSRMALSLWLIIGSVSLYIRPAQGYISCQAVPRERQLEWLKQMTTDFTHAELGHMSKEQITTAPYLLDAWSHTPQKSIEKALALESLVKRLVDERSAGNDLVKDLSVTQYNFLLQGWAMSGQGDAAAERCERIVEYMEQGGGALKPDLSSYKAVLMAWRQAESKHSALRAQRVLESMVRAYKNDPEVNGCVLPDSDCFDIVLQTWSRSGHPKAPEQAEGVLASMERLYENTGNKKLKPRTTSFNAVLAAWARSQHPKAADRASDLLGFMEVLVEQHGDVMAAPDNASYCTVMGAVVKHGQDTVISALKAERLLRRVEERHRNAPSSIAPDTILFNTAMGCWAKTNLSGSYRRSRSILDRQMSLFKTGCKGCKPDVFGYTSVIASAAAENGDASERNKAFNVALSTYRQMARDGVNPNHVTYGNMMKACARLLPQASPARRKWAKLIFEECCDAGYAGDMVLSRLREAVSPDMYKELLNGHSKKKLPASWTANLPFINHERKQRLSRGKTGEV